jgi:hypothetical protein
LIDDHQLIKEEKENYEEETKRKMQKLEHQLNELKSEHYQLVRTNKE